MRAEVTRAEDSAVDTYVRLNMEELCENCPLKAEFGDGAVFASIDERVTSAEGVDFCINDNKNLIGYLAPGTVRTDDIKEAFNGCERAVSNGAVDPLELSCGAIAHLQRGNGK